MLNQRIIKASVNENNEPVYVVEVRKFATPTGPIVCDTAALETAVSEALDYVYHTELGGAVCKANESYRKALDNFEKGKATAEDVLKAELKAKEAGARYAAYPSVPVCEDKMALFIAMAITGSRLVNIDKFSFALALLRSPKSEIRECKQAIKEYFEGAFNPKASDTTYLKPYTCSLNDRQVENLKMQARVYTLKWTEKGITEKAQNDRKVWQQTVLDIMRDAFRLNVTKADTTEALLYV